MFRSVLTIVTLMLGLILVASTFVNALEGRQRPLTKEEQALAKEIKLTFEEAKKIALQKAPGTIFNWELEREDGEVIYSIHIQLPDDNQNSREVNVNAMNGKIEEIEKENLQDSLKKAKSVSEKNEDKEDADKDGEKDEDDDDDR